MRILCLHSNSIEYEAVKKAIKEPEPITDKKGKVQDCLVVFMSVEKTDEKDPKGVAKRLVSEIKGISEQLKVKNIVLYPYVHLSSTPSKPATALEVLDFAEKGLKGFNVKRSPFGWYKSFSIDVKGHPLAELSREFGPEEKKKGGVESKFVFSSKKLTKQEKMNLTAAAMIGKAVVELYPSAVIGSIDLAHDQAYVDIAGLKLNQSQIAKIEKKAKHIESAFKAGTAKSKYQKEIAKDLGKAKAYDLDGTDFVMIYSDPFVSPKDIGVLKAFNLASAYWRGSADNSQLARIYCGGFATEKDLEKYEKKLEEAENRSHHTIGEQMELYAIFDKVGKGLPIWLPKGEIIKSEVEKLAIQMEDKYGYTRVSTPILAKKELFETSGHLPYYEDSMYPAMEMDDGIYYIKAMNCPTHHLIFNHKIKSYRDMPVRIAEYGQCHRNELSGALSGLQRVRCMSMNDAHIYLRKDQIEAEVEAMIKMVQEYYKIFGFKDYWFRLSLSDLSSKGKYIDQPENWKFAEAKLRAVLKRMKVPYVEAKDEAAFYGPKIDVQFKNVYGKDDTMSTIQLDFIAKERFNLTYMDEKGNKNNEVFVIHRAPLSTHERFIAFLIELYGGKFPLWLSPVQVKIVTVTDRSMKFAKDILKKMKSAGIRAELDERNETMGKKVRDAQLERVNYIVTIGDKEVEKKTLAIRARSGKVQFDVNIEDFINSLEKMITNRK